MAGVRFLFGFHLLRLFVFVDVSSVTPVHLAQTVDTALDLFKRRFSAYK